MVKIRSIFSITIFTALCAVLLFFLPVVQDYYDTGKQYAIVIITILSLCFWALVNTKKTTHAHITLSPAVYGFIALTVASGISLINSTNKIEAILQPYGVVTLFSFTLLLMILPTFISNHVHGKIRWIVYVSATLLSIISIYQYIGLGKSFLNTAPFLEDPLWTPTGYSFATISILLASLPMLIAEIKKSLKEKHEAFSAFSIVMTITVIIGLAITLFQFIPKISTTILPIHEGWRITLETLKNPTYILTGIGAENFLSAFSAGRSIQYNISPIWNIRFTSSSTWLFHVMTVYGLLGLAGFVLLLRSLITKLQYGATSVSLWILAISLLTTPPSIALLTYCVLILLLTYHGHAKTISFSLPQKPIIRYGISLILFACCAGSAYGMYRTITAEYFFFQSLQRAKENNGTQTYNLQVKSIQANRFISKYHSIYSQTCLAIAISLTNAINQPENTETADQKIKDQQLAASLIQQSIREAKISTTQNPVNILAWENLARIYSQLIDIAQGADTWTTTSYKRAIELDPHNPILRIELGSVALKQKQYTEAITQFQKSASLKQNYANAFYNLAYAYKTTGDINNAIAALKVTQSLVEKTSSDYDKVAKDIEALTAN